MLAVIQLGRAIGPIKLLRVPFSRSNHAGPQIRALSNEGVANFFVGAKNAAIRG